MAAPLTKLETKCGAGQESDTGLPAGGSAGRADGLDVSAGSGETGDGMLSALQYRVAVLRHYRPLFRFARAMLGTDADAEDVTQEAFTRYWQQGNGVRKPRQWLFKVAHNLSLDRLRVAGRLVSADLDYEPEADDDRGPAWHYGQNELSERLRRLVDALPEPQRSLIVLFDIQGMSGEECARIVGININQVKVYLHRARKRLRVKLEHSV